MCQACHGDASEHVKDPMKAKPVNPFAKGGTAEQRTAVCLTCHSGNRNLAFWTSGKHALNDVSCSSCHSVHGQSAPSYNGATLKPQPVTINKFTTTFLPNQAETCWQCHQQIRAANSSLPIIRSSKADQVLRLSQPAWRADAGDDQAADNQRPVLVPCGQARTVRVQPSAGRRELRTHNPHGSVHAKLSTNPRRTSPGLPRLSRHPGTVYGAASGFNCAAGRPSSQPVREQ
jgi:hypothetical protein